MEQACTAHAWDVHTGHEQTYADVHGARMHRASAVPGSGARGNKHRQRLACVCVGDRDGGVYIGMYVCMCCSFSPVDDIGRAIRAICACCVSDMCTSCMQTCDMVLTCTMEDGVLVHDTPHGVSDR